MKRSRIGLIAVLALLLVLAFGMQVSAAESKTVNYKKHTDKMTVSLSGKWTATSNKDWITVKKSGSTLKITIKKNKSDERSGKVKVKNSKGEVKMTIKITQGAYNIIDDRFEYDWKAAAKKYNKTDVTTKFLKKVIKVADALGCPPDDLMTVMAFESSLNHKAVNPNSGATGLIQFIPSTAARLGTSCSALKSMSAVKQLDYVKKYLAAFGKLENLGDLYMAILWPQGVGKKDSYVLWRSGSGEYERNSNLDVNNDGKVTRKECLKKVLKKRKEFVGE